MSENWEHLVPDEWESFYGHLWRDMRHVSRHAEAWQNHYLRKILPQWWRDAHAKRIRLLRASGLEPLIVRRSPRVSSEDGELRARFRDLLPDAKADYDALQTAIRALQHKQGDLSPKEVQELSRLKSRLDNFWQDWQHKTGLERQAVLDRYKKWKPHFEKYKQQTRERRKTKKRRELKAEMDRAFGKETERFELKTEFRKPNKTTRK